MPPRLPRPDDYSPDAIASRRSVAEQLSGAALGELSADDNGEPYRGNIENLMGFVRLPVGIASGQFVNAHNRLGRNRPTVDVLGSDRRK